MALNDLIKQAQQSRLGKAVGNLGNRFDADKAAPGFQFRTPQQRQLATQRQQGIQQQAQQFARTPINIPAPLGRTFNIVDRIAQVPRKFLEGVGEGSTMGLVDVPTPKSTSNLQKSAYGAGYGLGAFNPLNPVNKLGVFGKLDKAGSAVTSGIVSKLAPKATGFIAKKALPAVGAEAAQSVGYTGLAVGSGALGLRGQYDLSPQNLAKDIGAGLAFRGLGRFAPQQKKTVGKGIEVTKRGYDNVLREESRINEILNRYNTQFNEDRIGTPDKADVEMIEMATETWHRIYGRNKKPPLNVSQMVGDLAQALEGVKMEQLMKREGYVLGLTGNQPTKGVEAKEISGKQVSDYWSKELGVRPGDEDMLKLAEESGPYRLIDIKVKDIIEKDQNLAKEIANNKSMTNKLTSDSSGKAVIIDKDGVLDGYHRIAQTYKANPEATIKAYVSTRSSFTNSPTKGVEARYKDTLNVNNPDDAEYIRRVFSDWQLEDFKKGNFGNRTKEQVEDILRSNLDFGTYRKPKLEYKPMAKGEINQVFHGTAIENLPGIKQRGLLPGAKAEGARLGGGYGETQSTISTSTDPNIASRFTGSSQEGAVIRLDVDKNAKIVQADLEDAIDLEPHLKQLKKEKVDAVYIGGGEKEIVIINPKILTPQAKRIFEVYKNGGKVSDIPEEAFGVLGGFEPVYDEEGNFQGMKFNPTKAALGVGVMGGIKAVKNQPTKGVEPGKYKIIKQEGIFEVDGTPVKIADGLDTFIHEGTGGWVVSEKSSGQYMAVGITKQEAIKKAKNAVKDMGIDRVKKIISEKQLPTKGVGDLNDVKNRLLKVVVLPEVDKTAIKNASTIEELAPYLRKLEGGSLAKFFNNQPTKGVEPTKTFTFHSDSFSTQKIKTSKGTAVVKTIPSKQLKDQAQQALQNPAVQQSVRQADETLKTKVNLIDYMRTPEKVLQKIGLGKQASEIRRAYLNYSLELPKEIDRITQWYERAGANPEASKRIFKHMDGQGVMLSPQEQAVADEMKQYLKQWADRLGIPEDKRITNYITHLFEEDFIKKEFDPEIEKIIRNQIPGSVYDPFLQKRYGIAGYKEDAFAALDAYVKRATRKVHMDPALESLKKASQDLPDQSWQYVKKYADNVNLRPSDTDNLLDTAIKQSPIGYKLGQRPIANISRNLRTMVYRGTLGLNVGSAIRNLTQGANTYAELGERWTAKGYFDVTRDILSRSKELEEVGVLSGSLVQDRSLSATKKAGQKLDSILFSLFEIAEKINRGAAYYGAKARALSKGKSQEEAIQEGIDIARKTQFTFGSVDTPVAMQGDIAKMFSQFQSFNVKQAEFLLDKAAKKEYAGLLRYIGAWMVFAAAGKEVLGLDWKSAIPFSNVAEGESPVAQTPPFQLTSGILRAGIQGKDQYGGQLEGNPLQRIASDSEVQKAAGAMVIPAFTQGKKTLEGIMAFNRGYSETSSGRMRYPIEKTQGNQIKTGIFGQYSTKEAREYFDENKTPLGEQQTEIYKSLPADQGKEYLNMVEQERELNRIFDKLENEEINAQEAESLIQKVGASEGYSPLIDSKNKMLQEKMVSFTKKKVKAGLAVSEEELQAAYLDKSAQMPKSNRFEKSKRDSALYSSYSTIQSNEDLSDAQKQVLSTKIATELGKTPEDLQRYSIAKEDNDTKTMHALDQYEQSKSIDDFLRFLANGRTPINGHIMVSDGVIDNLVEEGIIPEALGKDFKSLDLNEDGTIKKGKIKGKSGKSAAKARAKAVNDAFEDLKRISIQSPKIRATSGSGTGRINTKALTFSGA